MPAKLTPIKPPTQHCPNSGGAGDRRGQTRPGTTGEHSQEAGARGSVGQLVGRRRQRLAASVGAVEASFCHWHASLVDGLADVDVEIEAIAHEDAHGMHEQSAFIRVALRCIADAIAELAAHATEGETAPSAVAAEASSEDWTA